MISTVFCYRSLTNKCMMNRRGNSDNISIKSLRISNRVHHALNTSLYRRERDEHTKERYKKDDEYQYLKKKRKKKSQVRFLSLP